MRSFADIIKDSPSLSDVHSANILTASGRRRRRRKTSLPSVYPRVAKLDIVVPITKTNDELQTVYGWATVNSENGVLVTDHQNDQVSDLEMTKAAHEFVSMSRHGGVLHALRDDGSPHSGGAVVESMVLTSDLQKALGIDLGKTGWLIGYRVTDPDAWALVKSGTLKAFSIGGRAQRVPL